MLDPAAIGTLLIGLNSLESESRHDRRRPAGAVRRRNRGSLRRAIAAGLRRAAASLEGPSIREAAR